MYIFKNAMSNILRNRKRNILVGVVILILIMASSISIVINNTTKGIISDYKDRFGSKVSIDIDIDKINEIAKNQNQMTLEFEDIKPQQYFDFADSKYLKSSSFMGQLPIDFGGELKAIDEGKENDSNNFFTLEGESIFIDDVESNSSSKPTIAPTSNMQLVSDISLLEEFKNKRRTIESGEFFKSDNEVLVSSEFAKLNNLKTGDKLLVQSISQKKASEVTISGIYKDLTDEYSNMPFIDPAMNRRNDVIMDIDSSFAKKSLDSIYIKANYELKNPDYLEDFKAELTKKGIPEIYKVTTDEASYNQIVAPVVGLEKITKTMTNIVLLIGSIILLLIQSISIRERKYEIGVLRAMGLKKSKLIRMFIYENLIITSLCLVIGLFSGITLSQPIANKMIDSQVEIAKENEFNEQNMNGVVIVGDSLSNQATDEKPLSDINVSLSKEAITQILGISLLIVSVTSTIGVITITKYEPMQILSDRN